MEYDEKLKLLKSIHGLGSVPERQLASLAQYLRPKKLDDGAVLFEEGAIGMSLYFIGSGKIRITKRTAHAVKDLAVLGAGEFFGEIAIAEEDCQRSAGAVAEGACVLFELFRGDLSRWAKASPQYAIQLFTELIHIQSQRLRRTSNELTLYFDLSDLSGEGPLTLSGYLAQALDRVLSHLEGAWSGAAYLDQGAQRELLVSRGNGAPGQINGDLSSAPAVAWLDERTIRVKAQIPERSGHLVLRAQSAVAAKDREDISRALGGVSRMISNALELIQLRAVGTTSKPAGN